MKFRIAVVQFEIAQYSPEQNLIRVESFIKEAVGRKAQVIVFPEDFITGPLVGRKEFVDTEHRYRKHFQALALKYHLDIVAGSFIEGDITSFYNTSYYIDRFGNMKGRYRKINLWLTERKHLTAGNEICVFNTRFGKAGLTICWDLAFPEIFRKMLQRGVQIVYCPSYWGKKDAGIGIKHDRDAEVKNVNALCGARAFEQEIILVYANAAGKLNIGNINNELIGQSQITVPFKGALKRLDHNREELFVQEVDTAILKDAERAYRIRRDVKYRVL